MRANEPDVAERGFVRLVGHAASMATSPTTERVVYIRPRTILQVLGIVLATIAILAFVYLAWHIITWVLVAIFLALALNPAVEKFERRGMRRGYASATVFLLALAAIVGLGFLVLPPLVRQVTDFIQAVPDLVDDLVAGRGPLGFLQRDYHIVDRIRTAIEDNGVGGVLGVTEPAIAVAQSLFSVIIGSVAIAFLTYFMLLDGPRMVERFYAFLPESARPRWQRVGHEIYRTVGGYVTGNILISVIAGVAAMVALFAVGSSYSVALAVVVAILDLVPLAGATMAAVIVSTVVFVELGWVRGVIIIAFFLLYQQLENHVLQPIIYGRTVQLSPLIVLISVLIGAELAGILGALAAIPVAGIVQAVGRELLRYRSEAAPTPP
ncbi:MAG TPA: AI-2E family transporter [Gaiellaceae bacterium]|nr:AI-2E family transporter [Gaiellaceae bacterium]